MYADRKELARASEMLQRALALREKALGPEHPLVAELLDTGIGRLYMEMGDNKRAEQAYARSLSIREKKLGEYNPDVSNSLNSLSAFYERTGDTLRAVQFRIRANNAIDYSLDLILTTGSEQQKREYAETLSGNTNSTISLNVQSAPSNIDATRLALTTILRRKGRALDAMSNQIEALRRRLTPEDRALLEELSARRAQLSALVLSGPSGNSSDKHRAAIAKLEAEIELLEAEVSKRSSEFRAQLQPVKIERVQQAIPVNAALVEIALYRPLNKQAKTDGERVSPERYVAYTLLRSGEPRWVDLGEATEIDKSVAALRGALADPKRTDVKRLARALDEKVMRPVRRLLGTTQHLFISPDGNLNLIPFGALVDEQNRYLIESYLITYLTSGRDLLRLQVPSKSRQGPVVLADPQFDLKIETTESKSSQQGNAERRSIDFAKARFGPLPGTAEEARRLGQILRGAKVLTRMQAAEATVKQVSGPSILHVATHGFFLPDQRPEGLLAVQSSGPELKPSG
ncbi:MAG: CHAT domain-containing protein, partial [Acidobacteria bacterium]|nr:CHAT domain-containing protein [Acidobacteriota bacterium]